MYGSFNERETIDILKKLVETPSPSGYTNEVMKVISSYLDELNVDYVKTNKGAIVATILGDNNSSHRLLTAHTDTLGAMVKEVKSNGRVKLSLIGGFSWNAMEGESCFIHTSSGKKVRGTILLHQTSVHVYKNSGSIERNADNMEIRIDEKVFSKEDTSKLGIDVGDFVSFDPRFEETESGFIKSRHLDDKASTALLLQLMKNIKSSNIQLPYTTHFYISNNEEIGYGGNSNIPSEVV
ncbi:MAG: peptidase M42, partial [Planococcaceae bacterium]|nr:peptidase M42 [Planococcaceae bacterium]